MGVTAADNRLFVEAVLYRYRSGMRGRSAERFGDGRTCINASAERKSGVWEKVFCNFR